MRVESSVTAITWLPFAALDAMPNMPLGIAVAHYDEPPPRRLGDVAALREADAFREANELRAWIEVESGEIVTYGREGTGFVTEAAVGAGEQIAFPAVEFPVLRPEPEVGQECVRFSQTVGGRIGMPVPRPLRRRPYVHIGSAVAWTTVELTLHADGRAEGALVGSSPFPRHTVYGGDGKLVEERGLVDPDSWCRDSEGEPTPWSMEGEGDALETQVDAELTRVVLGTGAKLARRRLGRGEALVEQGDEGGEMFLLLDGVLDVEVDGHAVAQVGSGALIGELAVLGDGRRTATLRAARACRVAVLAAHQVEGSRLAHLALARRDAPD